MPFLTNQLERVGLASQHMQLSVFLILWKHSLKRIGLLYVIILPLLLSPQASAASRPNEFSGKGTASIPLQPATADQYVPLLNAVRVAVGGRHTCALISGSKVAASLSEATNDPETAGYAVKCWGANRSNQIGDGMGGTSRGAPADVIIPLPIP